MKKLISFMFIVLLGGLAVRAQDDYHKFEVAGSYSFSRQAPNSGKQIDPSGNSPTFEPCSADGVQVLGPHLQGLYCNRRNFQGFDASANYNITRYIGIKGNVSGYFKKDQFTDQFGSGASLHTDHNETKERNFQFLGGVEIKDNKKEKRIKPFAQVLAGVARQTNYDVQTSTAGFNFTINDKVNSFAMKFGGGLDVRLNRKIDLRVFEVNYNPIFGRTREAKVTDGGFELILTGRRADNLVFSFGVVLH